LRRIRSVAYPFYIRDQQVADARNLLLAKRWGVVRLALLNACLSATPFSRSCDQWFYDQHVSDDEVLEQLVKTGLIKEREGSLCWPQQELEAAAELFN
jgi:hypothetical protein